MKREQPASVSRQIRRVACWLVGHEPDSSRRNCVRCGDKVVRKS